MSIDNADDETKLIVLVSADEEPSADTGGAAAPAAGTAVAAAANDGPPEAEPDESDCKTEKIDTDAEPPAADTAVAVAAVTDIDNGVLGAEPPETAEKIDTAAMPEKFAAVIPLAENCNWAGLRAKLLSWPPPEAADFIGRLGKARRRDAFRRLPNRFAAAVFSELEPATQAELLAELAAPEIRKLLANLAPDDRTALLDGLPVSTARGLLDLLSPQDLNLTRELRGYPKNSVGRMMTPNFVYINENWTVRQAINHIRRFGSDSETLDEVYVTDPAGKLLDAIPLSRLALTPPDNAVASLMTRYAAALSADDTQEAAVETIKKYNRYALPVVDAVGVMLGIVTIDDLMDKAETHATEDFHKLAAISVEAQTGPIENLRDAPVLLLYKRRVVWLLLLAAMSVSSGAGIAFFEDIILNIPVLVFFLTLLLGSGGNAGSQSATLMVRALATGDVKMKDWGRMLGKEVLVSSALGGVMAAAAAILGIFRGGRELAWQLALIVALSMFMIVVAGSLIGMCLPFALQKLKRDPAMASAPLVACISDTVAVLIYFSVAMAVLGN